jgi:hypothetical protein
MRYLGLIVLVSIFGLNTPVFAQTCCPAGGSLAGRGDACWFNGTTRYCGPATNCPPSTTRPPPPPTGHPTSAVPILPVTPACGDPYYLTPEARAAATNQCIADLAGTATVWRCAFFEDDAGRAEDVRTGLSCPARQRALANQCWRLCARFARARTVTIEMRIGKQLLAIWLATTMGTRPLIAADLGSLTPAP